RVNKSHVDQMRIDGFTCCLQDPEASKHPSIRHPCEKLWLAFSNLYHEAGSVDGSLLSMDALIILSFIQ
ncbi:hypothetical protein ACQP3J_33510, partial [Escherichia coli]